MEYQKFLADIARAGVDTIADMQANDEGQLVLGDEFVDSLIERLEEDYNLSIDKLRDLYKNMINDKVIEIDDISKDEIDNIDDKQIILITANIAVDILYDYIKEQSEKGDEDE